MADERWDQIHARPQLWSPAQSKLVTPIVHNPRCPEHCSGRHTVEARLSCPKRHGSGYHVVAHEWFSSPEHYFYTTEPVNGSGPWTPRCRDCGEEWVRV